MPIINTENNNNKEWHYMTREQRLETMLSQVMENWDNGCKPCEVDSTWEDATLLLNERSEAPSVTELCAAYPSINKYISALEDTMSALRFRYSLMRDELVRLNTRSLYGGRQAAANYTSMEQCAIESDHKLCLECPSCNRAGETIEYDPASGPLTSEHIGECKTCEGEGFIYIPKLL